MAEDTNNTEGAVTTPLGSVSFKGKRTAEFITILSLLLLAVLATLYWTHIQATDQQNASHVEAVRELTKSLREQSQSMTAALQEQTKSQRLTACLISLPQERREREFSSESSFCQRLSR